MDWTIILVPVGVLVMLSWMLLSGYTDKKNTGTPHPSVSSNSTLIKKKECKTETPTTKEQSTKANRCAYCNKDAVEKLPLDLGIGSANLHYCSESCKDEITKYIEEVKRYKGLFLGLILGSILIMVLVNGIIIAINQNPRLMALTTCVAVGIVGITIIIFPFSTPETVRWLGIKKARIVTRILGLILIVVGLLIPLPLIRL